VEQAEVESDRVASVPDSILMEVWAGPRMSVVRHTCRHTRPFSPEILLSNYPKEWWTGGELNSRHRDFQSRALPTELPVHVDRSAGTAVVPYQKGCGVSSSPPPRTEGR
jgi:hypothetical protein